MAVTDKTLFMIPAAQTTDIVIIRRVFKADVYKVWQHFTEPSLLKKWLRPGNFTMPFIRTDFYIGGEYLYCMRSAEGQDFWSKGIYKEIVPYRKLAFTDSFSDAGENIVSAAYYGIEGDWPLQLPLTMLFEEGEDEVTGFTLKQEGVPPEAKAVCRRIWNESFDKLDTSLTG